NLEHSRSVIPLNNLFCALIGRVIDDRHRHTDIVRHQRGVQALQALEKQFLARTGAYTDIYRYFFPVSAHTDRCLSLINTYGARREKSEPEEQQSVAIAITTFRRAPAVDIDHWTIRRATRRSIPQAIRRCGCHEF